MCQDLLETVLGRKQTLGKFCIMKKRREKKFTFMFSFSDKLMLWIRWVVEGLFLYKHHPTLQALVYGVLPLTTALTGYTTPNSKHWCMASFQTASTGVWHPSSSHCLNWLHHLKHQALVCGIIPLATALTGYTTSNSRHWCMASFL